MSLVCWNLKVFVQFGLNLGKTQTSVLVRQGYKKKKRKEKNLCSPAKSGPGIVKSLKPHIRMPKWLYFKALYYSIHDVLLQSMSKNRKQNTWAKRFPG